MSTDNDFSSEKPSDFNDSSLSGPSEGLLDLGPSESHQNLNNTTNDVHKNSDVPLDHMNGVNNMVPSLNPYEVWQKNFVERLEMLKKKEAEEIENRTRMAAAELEQWHKDRRNQIEEKLKQLLADEPSGKQEVPKEFDWITTSKYLETSEFFLKDLAGGPNQKLIELIMKKKEAEENARAST